MKLVRLNVAMGHERDEQLVFNADNLIAIFRDTDSTSVVQMADKTRHCVRGSLDEISARFEEAERD